MKNLLTILLTLAFSASVFAADTTTTAQTEATTTDKDAAVSDKDAAAAVDAKVEGKDGKKKKDVK